jgi:hypothetical protein
MPERRRPLGRSLAACVHHVGTVAGCSRTEPVEVFSLLIGAETTGYRGGDDWVAVERVKDVVGRLPTARTAPAGPTHENTAADEPAARQRFGVSHEPSRL